MPEPRRSLSVKRIVIATATVVTVAGLATVAVTARAEIAEVAHEARVSMFGDPDMVWEGGEFPEPVAATVYRVVPRTEVPAPVDVARMLGWEGHRHAVVEENVDRRGHGMRSAETDDWRVVVTAYPDVVALSASSECDTNATPPALPEAVAAAQKVLAGLGADPKTMRFAVVEPRDDVEVNNGPGVVTLRAIPVIEDRQDVADVVSSRIRVDRNGVCSVLGVGGIFEEITATDRQATPGDPRKVFEEIRHDTTWAAPMTVTGVTQTWVYDDGHDDGEGPRYVPGWRFTTSQGDYATDGTGKNLDWWPVD